MNISSDTLHFSELLARERAHRSLERCTLLDSCVQQMDQESRGRASARLRSSDRFNMASENGCSCIVEYILHTYGCRVVCDALCPHTRHRCSKHFIHVPVDKGQLLGCLQIYCVNFHPSEVISWDFTDDLRFT